MAKEQQKNKPISRASLPVEGDAPAIMSAAANPAPAVSAQEAEARELAGLPPAAPRVYKGSQEIDHDLFKLEVALMKKNVSFTDRPDIEKFEHCHIFHSVDSSGNRQTTSTAVGGHHHAIEVVQNPGGRPTIKVGPPRKWVMKKVKGRLTKVEQPIYLNAEQDDVDDHTHEWSYLGSERIVKRELSVEAEKLTAGVDARRNPAPVDGVLG